MLLGLKGWFTALSTIGKVGVVSAASALTVGVASNASNNPTPAPPPKPVPEVQGTSIEHQTITTTEAVPFEITDIDDAALAKGTTQVKTEGVDGVKTKTWDVTLTDGAETARTFVSEAITVSPITKVIAHGTYLAPPKPAPVVGNCDSNYSGACVPIASDVDCGGGSGNGPAYLYGTATVVGYDIYGLDRDGDGLACE
jgi:hypothetical protein